MAEKRTLRLFHKKEKKAKHPEKGHREPIVVKLFKEGADETNVSKSILQNNTESSQGSNSEATGTWNGEERRHRKFEHNQKYFTIMIYGLMFVFLAAIIISCILKISTITAFLSGILKVLAPFIGGALIAFIMNPIVKGIENGLFQRLFKMKGPKLKFILAIILSYILVFGLLVVGLTRLGPQLADSAKELVSQSNVLYDKALGITDTLSENFPNIDFKSIIDKISASLPDIIASISNSTADLVPTIFNTGVAIVKGIINGLLAIAISIYMICDKRRIARAATSLVYAIAPFKKAKSFIDTSKECFQIFGGFIIGKALDSLIIGIITFIVTSILKLPYAVLMSVIVGITNMIPFFGPIIGAIPGCIIYLCIDPFYALIFAIAILAIQQFDGWILGPMILGDSTGIRPIWVIFGITFFGAYYGFIGMFLGVPFTAVVLHLIEKALNKRLKKKNIEIT